jgi:hypothetical protein
MDQMDSCPMFTCLRTRPCLFGSALSEVLTSSDTTLLFWLCSVRSPRVFRHNLALFALPCPKSTRLQTQPCFFGSALSEVHSSSDTTLLCLLCLVRSPHVFRHSLAFLALPCPKLAHLRTLSCIVLSALSEANPTSDTYMIFSLFPSQ